MLNEIRWNNKLNLGHDLIDKQHRHLIEIINELINSLDEKHSLTVISTTINALLDYTEYHFEFEESYAKEIGKEISVEHIDEHRAFHTRISEFKGQFNSSSNAAIIELVLYLKGWLFMHLQGKDCEIFRLDH